MIRLLNGLVFVVCLIVALPISLVYWAVHMFRDIFKKKEYCSYHPEVELTDACDGDTPTPCIECWDDYRYPEEEF